MSNEVKTAELSSEKFDAIVNRINGLSLVMSIEFADAENSDNNASLDTLNKEYEDASEKLHNAIKNRVDNTAELSEVNRIADEIAKLDTIDTAELKNAEPVIHEVHCVNSMLKLADELRKSAKLQLATRKALVENIKPYVDSDKKYAENASELLDTLNSEVAELYSLLTPQNTASSENADKTASSQRANRVKIEPADYIKPSSENNKYINEDGTAKFKCKDVEYLLTASQVSECITAYSSACRMQDVTAVAYEYDDIKPLNPADKNAVWQHLKIVVNHNNLYIEKSA